MRRIYLDNAATTAIDRDVSDAMLPYMRELYGNPSSIHAAGRETRAAIEKARKTVAKYLNTSPAEIFFTSGGTEANNTAIKCAVRDLGIKHIISSSIEHHCVLHCVEEIEKSGSLKVHMVSLTDIGHIDLEDLEKKLSGIKEPCLVSLMHANNEIGNLLDIQKVGEMCERYKAYFHSDTVQTVAHYPIDLQKTKVHFISGAAHKFHGPKGIGFLYVNHKIKIQPYIHGGSQERNMRAGTENLIGIVGLAKALEISYEHLENESKKIAELKKYMVEKLKKEIPEVNFNGDYNGNSLYTVLNVAFPENDKSDMLLFSLDISGICASSGSACTSGSDVGSHVLAALKNQPKGTSVRFSFSKYNTKEEIDMVVSKLKELLLVEA